MSWMKSHQPLTTKNLSWDKKEIPTLSSSKLQGLIAGSYATNKDANNIAHKNGFNLDESLSDREHKVYVDDKKNPYVAFTGTRKASDWITNAALAVGLGGLTSRFRNSSKLVQDVKKKYNRPVTTIGHSLGGKISEYAGGDKVITVDKAAGLFDIGKRIKSNQTDIRTGSDPVSLLAKTQSGGKQITIKNTNFIDPLHAHNYRHLNKLNHKIL